MLDCGLLLRERRAGHSLPAPLYLSPEAYAADLAAIFARHWIFVGVDPDMPEPGDAMTVAFPPYEVLLVRDRAGTPRGFHNVCRHRGTRLVAQPKRSLANIVCRYHGWAYGLDGALRHAPNMGEGFAAECFGLKPVHVRSVGGLLFVCLADEPPSDIDDFTRDVLPYIAPHDLPNCKIAHEEDLIEHGNWKLTMENNRECYHCTANHPELTVPLFEFGFGFAPDPADPRKREAAARYAEIVAERRTFWDAAGLPSREIEHLADRATGFRLERLPLAGAGQSHTRDTRVACTKLLGRFDDPQQGALSLWIQPNSWHHFMSDHIVSFAVLPLAPERTLLRTKWLVHKDAVAGRDYDPANLTHIWLATNRQDAALIAAAHEGVGNAAYRPGPYSARTEGFVAKFCDWYLARLERHLAS
jgi:glycine betaine monooxygenase A